MAKWNKDTEILECRTLTTRAGALLARVSEDVNDGWNWEAWQGGRLGLCQARGSEEDESTCLKLMDKEGE